MKKAANNLEEIRLERLKNDIINLVKDSDKFSYLDKFTYLDQASVNDRLMELAEDFLNSIDKNINRT